MKTFEEFVEEVTTSNNIPDDVPAKPLGKDEEEDEENDEKCGKEKS